MLSSARSIAQSGRLAQACIASHCVTQYIHSMTGWFNFLIILLVIPTLLAEPASSGLSRHIQSVTPLVAAVAWSAVATVLVISPSTPFLDAL